MIQHQVTLLLCILLLLMGLAGCSSMQPIDSSLPGQELISGIEVGDQIEIKTKSGEIRLILVSLISDTYIESGDEEFLINEIEIVGQRKFSQGEKGMAIGAGLAVGVLMQALIMTLILGLAF